MTLDFGFYSDLISFRANPLKNSLLIVSVFFIYSILQKLSEGKLRSLYTDLLAQDKEEGTLKRLKSDGLDKDGLKEAAVRKKFRGSYFLFFTHHLTANPERIDV